MNATSSTMSSKWDPEIDRAVAEMEAEIDESDNDSGYYSEDDIPAARQKVGKEEPKDFMTLIQEAAKLKSCQLDEKQPTFKKAPEFLQMTLREEECLTEARKLPPDEKLAKSMEWKNEANKCLQSNDFDGARNLYIRALSVYLYFETQDDFRPLLDFSSEQPEHVALILNNLALLSQKMERIDDAMYFIQECLKRLPKSHASYPKALYRRASYELEVPNYEEAIKDLAEALRYDASNAAVQQLLAKAKHERNKAKSQLKGMFNQSIYADLDPEKEKEKDEARRKKQSEFAMKQWGQEHLSRRMEGATLGEHGIWIDKNGKPIV